MITERNVILTVAEANHGQVNLGNEWTDTGTTSIHTNSELVKKARDEANEEYVHSVADLMAIKGRPCFTRLGSFMVSDLTKSGLTDINYGWGRPLYSGLAKGGLGDFPGLSFYVPYITSKGEKGRVVPICLPEDAMERFEKELDDTLTNNDNTPMIMSNI